ncbi:hypothetical protein K438DRAFT_2000247 [Mycena galopus ATCC 62051]|nr:hypothetical protein K438DRAFT_2000247 [Mycena galopus ATCC 62051]
MAPTRRSVARATQWRTPTHGRKIKEIGGMGDLREGRLRESLVALLLLSFPLVRPLPLPPSSPHYRNLGVVDAARKPNANLRSWTCCSASAVTTSPPGTSLSTKTTSRSSSKTCTGELRRLATRVPGKPTLTLLLLVSFLSSPCPRLLALAPSSSSPPRALRPTHRNLGALGARRHLPLDEDDVVFGFEDGHCESSAVPPHACPVPSPRFFGPLPALFGRHPAT